MLTYFMCVKVEMLVIFPAALTTQGVYFVTNGKSINVVVERLVFVENYVC